MILSERNSAQAPLSAALVRPTTPSAGGSDRLRETFLLTVGRALHAHGAPTHRLEPELARLARGLGVEAQFLITPTSMLAAFGPPDDQRTHLVRVDQGDEDLGKLLELDEVAAAVEQGLDTPTGGVARIAEITARGPRYGRLGLLVGFALASGCAARFFGGGAVELALAAANGFLLGLGLLTLGARGLGWFEMGAALLMAFASTTLAATVLPHAHSVVLIAGLIVLVPGWTLTVGLLELARRHLVSGTSRLAKAASLFLMLGLGVALARKLGAATTGVPESVVTVPLAPWTEWVALALAPVGFLLLFGVRRREAAWVYVGGILGFLVARSASPELGPEGGAFLGALAVGLWANWFARRKLRPSLVPLVPALLLLVPGSLGFEGVRLFVAADAVSGMDVLFRMLMVGVSLASGLVLAQAALPSRRGV